ncbi:Dual specificity tyrosine-phosphorylation-regulated kinase [Cladochytrium tenue]|nr:Dual specificity tyrosine-phosphorylation-regulated kinase [Cladochytrium tenue]
MKRSNTLGSGSKSSIESAKESATEQEIPPIPKIDQVKKPQLAPPAQPTPQSVKQIPAPVPLQQPQQIPAFSQPFLAAPAYPTGQSAAQYTGRVANGVAISRSKTAGSTATRVVPSSTAATAAAAASVAAANARASFIAPSSSAFAAAAAAAAAGLSTPTPTAMPSPSPPYGTGSPSTASPSPAGVRLPMSPETALHFFRDLLTQYEQREIFGFAEVYCVGTPGTVKVGSPTRRTGAEGLPAGSVSKEDEIGIFNDGYDDSNGDYYLTVGDHMGYRYEIKSLLGKGSFGQVAKCFDHKTKTMVALKVIRNKKRFEKQGVVEVRVLDRIRREDADNTFNAVHMKDSFYFRHHLCITFELLGSNLYEWIKAGSFRGVHSGVIKRFALQIVECLMLDPAYVQPSRSDIIQSSTDSRAGRFPVDFDPSKPVYDIKAIDFGSSCFEPEKIYTYVQSRFYRSPEVILGKKRKPSTKTLAGVLRYADPLFLDFIERCLEWDPERRMVPDEAIRHEWLKEYVGLGKSAFSIQLFHELRRQQQMQQYQLQYQQKEQEYEQEQLRRQHCIYKWLLYAEGSQTG